ncbi:hypothetical protein LCGC14_0220480 [marine sediment metagenome]|uniref:Uncharacterized protein n=1 Tax=marine sediment metagenome TaxID=412755 RepID=A0A0F9UUK4_9ZZZZ
MSIWSGIVCETVTRTCRYWVEADSKNEAASKLENGETTEEETLSSGEVIDRTVEGDPFLSCDREM